jgi:glycosyltransferase involved in cell wall biosynthesis
MRFQTHTIYGQWFTSCSICLTANKEIVQDGSNGYIVTNETEWYDSLEKLIIDTNLRSEFGAKGREIIETKYTYQVWGNTKMIIDC